MNRKCAAGLMVAAAAMAAYSLPRQPSPRQVDPPADVVVLPPDPGVSFDQLRTAARDRLAREVIDGRRSVLEAAALFRELDRSAAPPLDPMRLDWVEPLPAPFPAGTEDEVYCRRVARWAYLILRGESPDRAAEVVARLAAEVREEAGIRGAVRLPDPADLEPVEVLLARPPGPR